VNKQLQWTTEEDFQKWLQQSKEQQQLMILNCHNVESMHCHMHFHNGEKFSVPPKKGMSQEQWVRTVVTSVMRGLLIDPLSLGLLAVSHEDYQLFDREFAKRGLPKRRVS
jgi:hypothetical protein